MAILKLADLPKAVLRNLPRDTVLLRAIWESLERAADNPAALIYPPPIPHHQGRRLLEIATNDSEGRCWMGYALFLYIPDDDALVLTSMTLNRLRSN